MLLDPIVTARLDLRVIDLPLVERLLDAPQAIDRPSVPEGWPDEDGRVHLGRWRGLLLEDGGPSPWRARTVVDRAGTLVGHAGFHGPPQPIEGALSDPTYAGAIDACVGGAVEVGYTILPSHRRRGLASGPCRVSSTGQRRRGWSARSSRVSLPRTRDLSLC